MVPIALSASARRLVALGAVVVLAGLGLFAVDRLLGEVSMRDIRAAWHGVSAARLALAVLFTAGSYLALTLYDAMALRVIGRPLRWRTAALASFVSYTLSHNLGLSLLTGGSARYRLYTGHGIGGGDIGRIMALAGAFFYGGLVIAGGLATALRQAPFPLGPLTVAPAAQPIILALVVAALAGLMPVLGRRRRSIALLRWQMPLPTARQGAGALAIATCDVTLACAVLFVLLPGAGSALFPAVLSAYCAALLIATLTHVPGGLGVFEAAMIAALPGIDRPELAAALIAYRLIYYLAPLGVAGIVLALYELRAWRRPVTAALGVSQSIAVALAPPLLAALTFTGGLILLVSGSLPAIPARLQALRLVVPLPFVEASHIAASLVGTALLLLAPGLFRRLDAAFHLTRLLLFAGAAFSLAKGFDYEEAAILLAIAAVLGWSRRAFYRRTAFTLDVFSGGWLAACTIAVALSAWIAFFAHKHVAYSNDLWWQFAWHSGASRALRASLAASVMLIAATVAWLFSAARPRSGEDVRDPGDIARLVADVERADAKLALVGDKRILTSSDGTAFVLYQIQGASWIVLGDPAGPQDRWSGLLWELRERADAAQGRLLLYQVSPAVLPFAIDLGLQIIKYGEEAHVQLATFSLEGPAFRNLRHSERRALRAGATVEFVPAANVPAILPVLERISASWLAAKGQGEKAFSIGRFDPSYLVQCDFAILRVDDRIVAFANLLQARRGGELSIDLMRHDAAMPPGGMDLLLVEIMRWGHAQGYATFNLGLAPLSGLAARRLATVWARAGAFLYRHGGSIYGFAGLRAFKAKFGPTWHPRYIAAVPGIGLARALYDLQVLVGGSRASASRARHPVTDRVRTGAPPRPANDRPAERVQMTPGSSALKSSAE
ncbi:bifunctional lysylphosphatidylglycerol flippase/synthetase MprF [Parablastomonas sp. CN1-191]|uniref:bifunctional lysylphosphatidylglycerol flippase/synthetase MprF n=1 Tax=Parablastomonas sp. CN1-191 TaxID=3400908 RepID=UPI003BF8E581